MVKTYGWSEHPMFEWFFSPIPMVTNQLPPGWQEGNRCSMQEDQLKALCTEEKARTNDFGELPSRRQLDGAICDALLWLSST